MNWYYMTTGATSEERKGPISHPNFLTMVQQGKVPQTALASSPELTGGKWLAVKDIPILRKAREGAAEKKSTVGPTSAGQAPQKPPSSPAPPNPFEGLDEDRPRFDDALPIIQVRSSRASPVRPVFQQYWLPLYLQVIWYVALIANGLVLLGFLVLLIGAMSRTRFDAEMTLAAIGMVFVLVFASAFWLLVIRLFLEMYAIFFDIRSYVKRTAELLEERVSP